MPVGMTILFADGAPEARSEAIVALEGAGCTVLPASNGREALWIMSRRRPDIVLAEVELPGIDGIALAWHIRAWFPDVPVVLISAELREADLAQLRPLYNTFLPKPVSAAQLIDLAAKLSKDISRRRPAASGAALAAGGCGSG